MSYKGMTHDVDKRIQQYTLPVPECGCLIWTGDTNYGYGIMSINHKTVRMHRYMYEKINGPVPEGLFVLHKCDVRSCVNPLHLYIGTQDENMADRQLRNRQVKGSLVNTSKLSESQVFEIRRKYIPKVYAIKRLAVEYGVSTTAISKIISRVNWGHI